MAGQSSSSVTRILGGAVLLGGIVGIGSVAVTPQGRSSITNAADGVAVAAGVKRRRAPAPGDHWTGCNDARQAGTAPIYRDEPGYRPDMDGDGDGIACEPIRG